MLAILLVAMLLAACIPGLAAAQCAPLADAKAVSSAAKAGSREASGAGSESPFSCRFDAALTREFTPGTVPKDTYRVYVTEAGIDKVVAAFRAVGSSSNAEGAWVVQELDPLDAYGKAGNYDRAKVARLYLGVRARVARGPILEQGRTIASITLVSPYPDPSLTRLVRGTLIIEFRTRGE